MSAPTLLIGLGATKAGTSWLDAYLRQHPQCHLRSVKELHYFNSLAFKTQRRRTRQLERKASDLRAKLRAHPSRHADSRSWRVADLEALAQVFGAPDHSAYLAYLVDGRRDELVVADITPAYGMLPVQWLAQIFGLPLSVKTLYMMRDPVDRLWSQVRMSARREDGEAPETVASRASETLASILAGDHHPSVSRGDYRGTLDRLAAFDPEQILILFYEDLFTEETIDRICAYLGIDPAPAALKTRTHQGVEAPLPPSQRAAAAAFLSDQYEAVRDHMGCLPAAWRKNMELAA